MGFAITSLVITILGLILVGVAAFGAGYAAGQVLVIGVLAVSFFATLLAAASFAGKKKAPGLSVLAIAIALAPSLLLGAKYIENQYYNFRTDRSQAQDNPGGYAQSAPAPAVVVDQEAGAVVVPSTAPP